MRKLWNGGSGIKQQPSSKEESRTQMVEEGKKNTLACMQLHTNELNRFSYTWAHELNERKTIIFKRSTSCSPTFNVKMCFFFVDFFSPICSSVQILCSHFLFHSAVWVLHTLFTMLFLCFNNENYVKKTEHAYTPGKRERARARGRDRMWGENWITIWIGTKRTKKNQTNIKCAIFYALYKTICNESLSETNKEQKNGIIIIIIIIKRIKIIHIFASFFESFHAEATGCWCYIAFAACHSRIY